MGVYQDFFLPHTSTEHFRHPACHYLYSCQQQQKLSGIAAAKFRFLFISMVELAAHSKTGLSYPAVVIDPYMHNSESVSGIAVSWYQRDGKRIFHVKNYNMQTKTVDLSLLSTDTPIVYNSENEEVVPLAAYAEENDWFRCTLYLSANRSLLLVCGI